MDCYIKKKKKKRRFYIAYKLPSLYYKSLSGGIFDGERKSTLWPDAFIVPSGPLTVRHWRYIIYRRSSTKAQWYFTTISEWFLTAMRFTCNLSFDCAGETSGFRAYATGDIIDKSTSYRVTSPLLGTPWKKDIVFVHDWKLYPTTYNDKGKNIILFCFVRFIIRDFFPFRSPEMLFYIFVRVRDECVYISNIYVCMYIHVGESI